MYLDIAREEKIVNRFLALMEEAQGSELSVNDFRLVECFVACLDIVESVNTKLDIEGA